MKVLLVNGFSPTPVGLRAFHRFETAVREVPSTQAFQHQKFFLSEDIEFTTVDSESLSVYLFELNTGFYNKDAEKLFDHLDMIFVDGDASMLPWFGRCAKVEQYAVPDSCPDVQKNGEGLVWVHVCDAGVDLFMRYELVYRENCEWGRERNSPGQVHPHVEGRVTQTRLRRDVP